MKKTMLLLALAGSMIAAMPSCKKEGTPAPPVTQTIDVNLRTGESYTFTLPKNLRNDPYEITTQAKHASISQLCVDSLGNRVYKYTPGTGYAGSDQVIVSNDQERRHDCGASQGPPPGGNKHGNCAGEEEDHYIITLNFTMQDTAVSARK